jgi:hypothetical protein
MRRTLVAALLGVTMIASCTARGPTFEGSELRVVACEQLWTGRCYQATVTNVGRDPGDGRCRIVLAGGMDQPVRYRYDWITMKDVAVGGSSLISVGLVPENEGLTFAEVECEPGA